MHIGCPHWHFICWLLFSWSWHFDLLQTELASPVHGRLQLFTLWLFSEGINARDLLQCYVPPWFSSIPCHAPQQAKSHGLRLRFTVLRKLHRRREFFKQQVKESLRAVSIQSILMHRGYPLDCNPSEFIHDTSTGPQLFLSQPLVKGRGYGKNKETKC